ncbi:hypothetical protein ACFWRX_10830 [Streptomyces albidoflavus]|uniref:hypothetical protein n=1 Tax=Streptomyces sp. DR3-1 TaxID=2951169 RepID=UPI0020439147|nr:hypothetical protein [Streptomyces sp. DR3-1]MCM3820583.1 hypothetical protein [Streptomyces sp. DR3-1]
MDDGTDEYGPPQAGGPAGQEADPPGEAPGPPGEPGDEVPAPAGPAPLGLVREETGEPRVDAALGRLGDVDHLATDGHLTVYEDVHQGLRAALDALDAPPGPSAPPPARPDGSAGRAH